jgi:ribosomal protein S18 acetylase RimI-like enzyme
MKLLRSILTLFVVTIFYHTYIESTPSIKPFNYVNDFKAVDAILKAEWRKLFGTNVYDINIVNLMFKHQKPGDINARASHLRCNVLVNENKEIIGFITYYFPVLTVCHIELLAVKAEKQSKGFGKALVNALIESLKSTGCKRIELYVFTNNPKAIDFYKRMGFIVKNNMGFYCTMDRALS